MFQDTFGVSLEYVKQLVTDECLYYLKAVKYYFMVR